MVHKTRKIWKAYAPVDQWEPAIEKWVPAVLEITEALESALTSRRLRGEVWMLSRSTKGRNGPLVGLYAETQRETDLRPAFSIVSVLERFYHVDDLVVGVPNPIPRQVYLEPIDGQAPKILAELAELPKIDPAEQQRIKDEFRAKLRDFARNGKGGAH